MSFRENLKYYRKQAGYKTAKEFADSLDVPYNTYTAYENQKREPKIEMLIKIADLLNVSLDELIRPRVHKFDRYILNLLNKDSEFKIGE